MNIGVAYDNGQIAANLGSCKQVLVVTTDGREPVSKHMAEVPGTCIKCQRCVRKCTKHAKYFDDPAFLSHVAMLEQNFTEPKENEVYL